MLCHEYLQCEKRGRKEIKNISVFNREEIRKTDRRQGHHSNIPFPLRNTKCVPSFPIYMIICVEITHTLTPTPPLSTMAGFSSTYPLKNVLGGLVRMKNTEALRTEEANRCVKTSSRLNGKFSCLEILWLDSFVHPLRAMSSIDLDHSPRNTSENIKKKEHLSWKET